MLRVLVVDDEPFIVQGLSVLIDWESEDCQIVGTVANGKEALDFLKQQEVEPDSCGYSDARHEWFGAFGNCKNTKIVECLVCNFKRI